MVKFKMTCPDCGTAVVTASPQAMIWERCPSCGRHCWDSYDVLMAEVHVPGIHAYCGHISHAGN